MSSGSERGMAGGGGRTALKLAPLALPVALLFGGGLALAVAQSFGLLLPAPASGELWGGPWAGYARLLEPHLLASLGMSLWVGLASAALATALGAVLAWGVWRLPPSLERLGLVYKTPLILPHIAVAFLAILLWSRSGLLASVAWQSGWIDAPADFPDLLYAGGGGMILAYVYKMTPFALLLAHAALRRLDPRLAETARMLGAGEGRVFLRIGVAHMAPVLHTVFIILFLYAFGAFDIPFALGGGQPRMLSVTIYTLYFERSLAERPAAMALLVVVFLLAAGCIAAYVRVAARLGGEVRKL